MPLDLKNFLRFDGKRLLIHSRYVDLLKTHGLDSFEKIYSATSGRLLRERQCRANVVFEFPEGSFFLKRHREVIPSFGILGGLFRGDSRSPARSEFENILLLNRVGLPTMTPVALGEERKAFFFRRSFLLVEKIPDAEPLDDYTSRVFQSPLSSSSFRAKREIILHLALFAREFHLSGFNHRDFYLNHFFVRREPEIQIFLIDLQRMEHRRLFRRRWIVKDIASLNFSAPQSVISRTDRIRFLRAYFNVPKLRREEKAFIVRVLAKTERIRRHHEKSAECGVRSAEWGEKKMVKG